MLVLIKNPWYLQKNVLVHTHLFPFNFHVFFLAEFSGCCWQGVLSSEWTMVKCGLCKVEAQRRGERWGSSIFSPNACKAVDINGVVKCKFFWPDFSPFGQNPRSVASPHRRSFFFFFRLVLSVFLSFCPSVYLSFSLLLFSLLPFWHLQIGLGIGMTNERLNWHMNDRET